MGSSRRGYREFLHQNTFEEHPKRMGIPPGQMQMYRWHRNPPFFPIVETATYSRYLRSRW
jgi:hypothetical protein